MLQQMLAIAVRGRRVPSKGFTALNSKRGPRTFYKGKGAEPTGRHTRKGSVVVNEKQAVMLLDTADWCSGGYETLKGKLPEYVVPDLKGFAVRKSAEKLL